ncbi:GNAT family N-acetyltransferase [Amycolatopsis sp. H20-H5]|uniref:GNAT family N-acetyltransferase n=1 Tax=Amycolatopsis sp. H20-H5 TaxID=3046309 RepID=UPI002DBA4333|nr:GNAT family N-acetyltransferase [Amycolatopsis sp. H20-H5]MEC3981371.1 GNAT family N-acetyltransferase [Amycolatopsis sp. H20-H5]
MLTEIKTERLLLRRPREEDRQALVALQHNPRTNTFNAVKPTPEKAAADVERWFQHWSEHGFGYFAVSEIGSDEIAGIAGVRHHEFEDEQMLNLAYRFQPSTWGNGYTTEAAAAAVEWAERELPELPVLISVNVTNLPSLKVAERLGFTGYTESRYENALVRNYRR